MLDVKADENWGAYHCCLEGKHFNAAASRLYYSVFQDIYWWAQLIGKLDPNRDKTDVHSKVLLLVKAYCEKHPLSVNFVFRDLQKLLELRRSADYDTDLLNRDDVVPLEGPAESIRIYFKKEAKNVRK